MGLNLPLPRIRNARTRRDHFVQRELGRLQPARSAGVLTKVGPKGVVRVANGVAGDTTAETNIVPRWG